MRAQKLDEMLRLRGQQARFRHRIDGNRRAAERRAAWDVLRRRCARVCRLSGV